MIRADRGPEPIGFAARARGWRTRFRAARASNPTITISQFWSSIRAEIRPDANTLSRAFHGKCAYCESKMAHVTNPHVEHYKPKKLFPELAFHWGNWLLSCGRCNDNKWAHYPACDGEPCLIDPTCEDPAEHIEFERYLVVGKTKRGQKTIRLIGLDRSPLEDERSQWLVRIEVLLLLWLEPEFKDVARNLLIWCMQDEAPYAAMTRCYLRQVAPAFAAPPQLHPHIHEPDAMQRIESLVAEHAERLRELT